jgi:hypothetical protein
MAAPGQCAATRLHLDCDGRRRYMHALPGIERNAALGRRADENNAAGHPDQVAMTTPVAPERQAQKDGAGPFGPAPFV